MPVPQLTALMTTYNSSRYLVDTINSVLNQSFSNFDFVIVDDGSIDNTVEIIKNYSDSRIRLFCRSENKGVGYSLQEAMLHVRTPYVIKVDSDDLSHFERFAIQLNYLQENPDIAVVKCYIEAFAESDDLETIERLNTRQRDYSAANQINTESLIRQHLPRWLCVEHTSYCARTDAIKSVGYPDQRLCEDYSLFYRLNDLGYRIGCVPKYLVKVRVNKQSVTAHVNTEQLLSWFTYVFELKKQRIIQILGDAPGIAIYGSGGLARLMFRILNHHGIQVLNFVEQNSKSPMVIDGVEVPVKSLSDCLKQKILIAAQPVRLQIVQQLTEFGLVEWHDFMVIA